MTKNFIPLLRKAIVSNPKVVIIRDKAKSPTAKHEDNDQAYADPKTKHSGNPKAQKTGIKSKPIITNSN